MKHKLQMMKMRWLSAAVMLTLYTSSSWAFSIDDVEGKVADESAYIGRTYGDAPKVDGYIFVQTGELLMTGDFAKVRVTGALEYDLIGELADEYTE